MNGKCFSTVDLPIQAVLWVCHLWAQCCQSTSVNFWNLVDLSLRISTCSNPGGYILLQYLSLMQENSSSSWSLDRYTLINTRYFKPLKAVLWWTAAIHRFKEFRYSNARYVLNPVLNIPSFDKPPQFIEGVIIFRRKWVIRQQNWGISLFKKQGMYSTQSIAIMALDPVRTHINYQRGGSCYNDGNF